MWEAVKAVASGYSDCALALGWERMDEVPTDEGNHLISAAADKDWETPLGHIYTGYYGFISGYYGRNCRKKSRICAYEPPCSSTNGHHY